MSEQIGLAVTSEPLSTENIEQMMEWTYGITPPDVYQAAQSELAAIHRLSTHDQAAEWVDLAALHDAKIKRLRAELYNLHGKYIAAYQELHELRIKCGLLSR